MPTIRSATVDDIPAIQEVLAITWANTYPHLQPETVEKAKAAWHSIELLTKQIQNPETFFQVAEDQGSVAGLVTAALKDNFVEIYRLYVHPEQQRKGIGSQLFAAVKNHFADDRKMQVQVEAQNICALEFYQSKGFKKIRQVEDDSFGEVMLEWIMERDASQQN